MAKFIVSLTSHTSRIKFLDKALRNIANPHSDYKVVLTLFKDDIKFITNEIYEFISKNLITLVTSEVDLGPHLKYFYVMKSNTDLPVITIDDDCIYTEGILRSLYNKYIAEPEFIHARRCHRILVKNGAILPYNKWVYQDVTTFSHSNYLLATGVGGVIYPPNVFELSDNDIPEILECKYADDIYLKVLELRNNKYVKWLPNNKLHPDKINESEVIESSLYKINNFKNRNDEYIRKFEKDFKVLIK